MLPSTYQIILESQLGRENYLLLNILITLLQSMRLVSLEKLATGLPIPIKFASRRRKIQRFLSLPELSVEGLWFPIFSQWLKDIVPAKKTVLYLAIDRTNWGCINFLFISLVWNNRAYPVYWELLNKKGSSNFEEQIQVIGKVKSLFKGYKVVLLGDREFCSVKLANWLGESKWYFCLRLKKNEYVELGGEDWLTLQKLGLEPGTSLFLEGVRVTKTGFGNFNLACKWKKKVRGWAPEEGWFILTNLEDLDTAIKAYKRRFGIEEMFRDFKSGGYNLEGTQVKGERLVVLVLLISIAYISATMQGEKIKRTGFQDYIGRVKEPGRVERRHSSFYIGLYGQEWVKYWDRCLDEVAELMRMTRNHWQNYKAGIRAMELILSTF
jgi:hypothetical protein